MQSPTDHSTATMPYTARFSMIPILTGAFALSVAIWSTWFVTHLPWAGIPEAVSLPIILAVWLVGSTAYSSCVLWGHLAQSAMMGLVTALIGLLLLGTKLTETAGPEVDAASVKPNALLIAVGFLCVGSALGLMGGLIARAVTGTAPRKGYVPLSTGSTNELWLGRFAKVTVAAIFPLLLIGGLVTSTNSGMAVPDWPNTFGSNMLLYPLGPRAKPGVFLEHSHRLFGMFVGLSTVVLLVLTLVHSTRRSAKIAAGVVFALVIVQGVLGGLRVRDGNPIHELDDRHMALIHGILGQIFLAATVALAALLSRAARTGDGYAIAKENKGARRVRIFATAAMHSTIIQLVFGAMYRHLRDGKGGGHALMAHMAFSLVVVITAGLAASAAVSLKDQKRDPLAASIASAGSFLFLVFTVQFALGWITWALGGKTHNPEPWQAVLRTAHQANGALLLAVVTWMAILAKKFPKRV